MSLRQAFYHVKERRSVIMPRHEFIGQLGRWEMSLHHVDAPTLHAEEVYEGTTLLNVDGGLKGATGTTSVNVDNGDYRMDPSDGEHRTLEQLQKLCSSQYSHAEIMAYWDKCTRIT